MFRCRGRMCWNKCYNIMNKSAITEKIIALEKSAMEAWLDGNPSPFLELYSEDFTYFDPSMEKRLDGLDKIRELYEGMRGKLKTDRFEMVNPVVQLNGSMAVLSYNLEIFSGGTVWKENCTEVYSLGEDGMCRIVHSHFSPTKVKTG